jgi:hypothetical protein
MSGRAGKYSVKCGQKFTPLTVREVLQPFDVNFAAWREVYARQITADLVINAVAPSFAFDNQWTFIEGAGAELFENEAMKARYQLSDSIRGALDKLRESRRIMQQNAATNSAVASLDTKTYEAIEYAQSFLMLSDIVLCSTMEYALRTLASLPSMYSRWPERESIGCPQDKFLHSFPDFAKVCFDVLYGAHCMHTKTHLVHTDLHANNITLNEYGIGCARLGGSLLVAGDEKLPTPVVAYITGKRGEADTFVFPYAGLTGTIIDFSRGIFGPAASEGLAREHGEKYPLMFYRDQESRVFKAIYRYAPGVVEKHRIAIKKLIATRFEDVFRALSYVDFIAAGHSFASTFEMYTPDPEYDQRKFDPAPECAKFAKHIEKVARTAFITHLHTLLDEKKRSDSAIPFAGEKLLHELFPGFLFSKMSTTPPWSPIARPPKPPVDTTKTGGKEDSPEFKQLLLCDIFNYNNEVVWSGRDYKSFPPWAKLETIAKHAPGIKIGDIVGRADPPVIESNALLVDKVSAQIRAEQDALDAPAGPTSSDQLLD